MSPNNGAHEEIEYEDVEYLESEEEDNTESETDVPEGTHQTNVNRRKTHHMVLPIPEENEYKGLDKEIESLKVKEDLKIILMSTNITPFKTSMQNVVCFYCNVVINSSKAFVEHREKHETERYDFEHRAIHSIEDKNKYIKVDITNLECSLCFKKKKWYKLVEHLQRMHKLKISKSNYKKYVPFELFNKDLKCVKCGAKFLHFTQLNDHMNSHYGCLLCTLCDVEFTDLKVFSSHLWNHRKTVCLSCNKCFKNKRIFGAHLRSHKIAEEKKPKNQHLDNVYGISSTETSDEKDLIKNLQEPCSNESDADKTGNSISGQCSKEISIEANEIPRENSKGIAIVANRISKERSKDELEDANRIPKEPSKDELEDANKIPSKRCKGELEDANRIPKERSQDEMGNANKIPRKRANVELEDANRIPRERPKDELEDANKIPRKSATGELEDANRIPRERSKDELEDTDRKQILIKANTIPEKRSKEMSNVTNDIPKRCSKEILDNSNKISKRRSKDGANGIGKRRSNKIVVIIHCSVCGEQFKNYYSRYVHRLKTHEIDDRFKCCVCGEVYYSKKYYLAHTRTKHPANYKYAYREVTSRYHKQFVTEHEQV